MRKLIHLLVGLLAWVALQDQVIAEPLIFSGSADNSFIKPNQITHCFTIEKEALAYSVANCNTFENVPLTEIFNRSGKKIGEDKNGADGSISIIIDKKEAARIKENTKKGQLATSDDVSKGYRLKKSVLKASLNVLKRTEKNGGLREEVSIVMKDEQIIIGKPGSVQTIDNGILSAAAKIPNLPDGKTAEDVEAVIHSHPTRSIIQDRALYSQSALIPTPPDFLTGCWGDYPSIGKYNNNVIVGRLGTANYDSRTGSILNRPLIAAFYKRGSVSPKIYLSKYALNKIIE